MTKDPITVTYAEFRNAVRWVFPHAAHSTSTIDVLEHIHLYTAGDYLIVEASDRYTLARYRIELTSPPGTEPIDVCVNAKDVYTMCKSMPVKPVDPTTLSITTDTDQTTLFAIGDLALMSADHVETSYPNLDQFVANINDKATSANPTASLRVAAQHLARLKPAVMPKAPSARNATYYLTFIGEGKPIIVSVPDEPNLYIVTVSLIPEEPRPTSWTGQC